MFLELDISQEYLNLMEQLDEDEIRKVTARSMNTAARRARREMAEALVQIWGGKRSKAQRLISLQRRANPRQDVEDQQVSIAISNRRPSLSGFQPRQTSQGVKHTHKMRGPVRGGFVQTIGGNKHVWLRGSQLGIPSYRGPRRRSRESGQRYRPELPIVVQKGESLAAAARSIPERLQEILEREYSTAMTLNIEKQIDAR